MGRQIKIGIISGMGALAGSRFYGMLIKACQKNGAVKDSDFPEIILHNIPSRGMNEKGIGNRMLVKKELSASIRLLNKAGVEVIVIACNTVHVFIDQLQLHSKARILSMIEAAVDSVRSTKVGLITSRSTREMGLYSEPLKAKGIKVMQPTDQKYIDLLIGKAISGRISSKDRKEFRKIISSLGDEVVLGCTELPLVVSRGCIDPSRALINKVLSL